MIQIAKEAREDDELSMNLFHESKKILDKDGKVNPVSMEDKTYRS